MTDQTPFDLFVDGAEERARDRFGDVGQNATVSLGLLMSGHRARAISSGDAINQSINNFEEESNEYQVCGRGSGRLP